MTSRRSLHDSDFYAWSLEQAALLRAGRVDEADLAAIAEEIESMGKTEKRELVSRLTVLLLHLPKWRRQPSHRDKSWRLLIANARDDIGGHLDDNPSLKAMLDSAMEQAPRLLLRPEDHVLVIGCRGRPSARRYRSTYKRAACFAVAHHLTSSKLYRALAPWPQTCYAPPLHGKRGRTPGRQPDQTFAPRTANLA
jgi:hypothetical protein